MAFGQICSSIRAGIGQAFKTRRRLFCRTTLARHFVLLNEIWLRLAIPARKTHLRLSPRNTYEKSAQPVRFFDKRVAGAGIAPATFRLCIPLRLSLLRKTCANSWSGLYLHPFRLRGCWVA